MYLSRFYHFIAIVLLIVSGSGRLAAQSVPAGRYVNLAHLDHLYQTVTLPNNATVGTIAIYSNAPDYRLVGDDDEGFTCIDDVARAALFLLNEPDLKTNTDKQTKLRAMTEFVLQLQAPDGVSGAGYFYNFLWPDRTINTTFRTSVAEANFWSWRAFWHLTEAYPYYRKRDAAFAGRILTATQRITANVVRDFGDKPAEYGRMQGVAVPTWLPFGSGTDQAAILLLCLANVQQRQANPAVLRLIDKLGSGIVAMQQGGPNQFPYGAILSFENTWHAYASDQAYALLRVGKQLAKPGWLAAARREIDNFYPWLIRQQYLESFAVKQTGTTLTPIRTSQFSQIAYGIRPMIWAALEAYDQTKNPRYATLARKLASWFLGKNVANTPMYDRSTGRGYDGIGATGVNRNSGAESTIESLWAFQRLEKYKILKSETGRRAERKSEIGPPKRSVSCASHSFYLSLFRSLNMANVTLTHIAKAYGNGPTVIRDVSIDVRDQEFVVLVGPSGCGKSTLLRMIAGLEDITSGDLLLDGKRINDLPPKDRDIAMVFQNYALYPHMTVFENMAFGLKLRNMAKADIRERVMQAARILEIENLLDRKPKDMSGGQRQRVAIGRAIVREPKVFLFDEPLSNLDAKLRGQTRIELQKLHRQLRATMIYVTHDQVEAMTLGDRIVVLRGGDVMQFDTPLTLYNRPANRFVAGFIGTPPMNFLPGQVRSIDGIHCFVPSNVEIQLPITDVAQQTALTPYVGKAVTLGIRAEHLTTAPVDEQAVPLPVRIDALENMGNEALAYVTMGGSRLVARLSPTDALSLAVGQSATFFLNTVQAHFFDDATELVIR